MKHNHSAMRQRFMREQKKIARQYRAAGMTDDAIRQMLEFDLTVFRSNRNDLAHKAEIEEMTSYDRITGESHYMDMDEFPTKENDGAYSIESEGWIQEIENVNLQKAVLSLKPAYKEIISLLIQGYCQRDIAGIYGVTEATMSDKISRIQKKIKKFL